ncbi:hypothetical protein AVEN_25329-1 [Araneus ventricosus]|uniref:Uncharacterized protein n=1 Tax=Araneus ventricosus TaxID=182803 RepID=A0A4Y2EHH4_ARAVE|nr:hypothetical protein AVEN_25329-1 [Araneus ventricosus]
MNRKLFPSRTTTGNIQVKSCFGNKILYQTANFSFASHEDRKPVEIEAIISDQLEMEGIFPPDCLKLFELNELPGVQDEQINSFSSEIQNKFPFVSAVLENESLDLTHIIDCSLGDQVEHLVKGYEPAKEPKVTRSKSGNRTPRNKWKLFRPFKHS